MGVAATVAGAEGAAPGVSGAGVIFAAGRAGSASAGAGEAARGGAPRPFAPIGKAWPMAGASALEGIPCGAGPGSAASGWRGGLAPGRAWRGAAAASSRALAAAAGIAGAVLADAGATGSTAFFVVGMGS